MFYSFEILFIDESIIYNNDNSKFLDFVKSKGFPFKVIKIEDIFDID